MEIPALSILPVRPIILPENKKGSFNFYWGNHFLTFKKKEKKKKMLL